ncbi:uncharacterized protein TNCV_203351 [Trichonephila clavipes]|nr:uncharacterized protein TNCV_203351 [Trichonephila clavipes]
MSVLLVGGSTVLLDSTPVLRGEKNPGGGQGPTISLPLPPTSREDLWLDGYLEYLFAAKVLYIYKHPCLLRDSNTGPTALHTHPHVPSALAYLTYTSFFSRRVLTDTSTQTHDSIETSPATSLRTRQFACQGNAWEF